MQFTIDVWGDLACFTPVYAKVERMSSPVPTPSAMRGVFDAIYVKPVEFHWEIRKIEVMNPIKYLEFITKEIKPLSQPKGNEISVIDKSECSTLRNTVALKNVYYRVTAELIPRENFKDREDRLCKQASRRIRKGQCFNQPYLGMRNFPAFFSEPDMSKKPIPITMDFGLMLYDTFDFESTDRFSNNGKTRPNVSLYPCVMKNGVIEVPAYDSDVVLKGGRQDA